MVNGRAVNSESNELLKEELNYLKARKKAMEEREKSGSSSQPNNKQTDQKQKSPE